jgi:hypothetical protein
MTASTASIPVLHSAEVVAFENPLQFMGRALARIPCLTAIATKSTREPPCMQSPTALAPFG